MAITEVTWQTLSYISELIDLELFVYLDDASERMYENDMQTITLLTLLYKNGQYQVRLYLHFASFILQEYFCEAKVISIFGYELINRI